jgi:hypothetical protein
MSDLNGALQAWLRSLLIIGSVFASVIGFALREESRMTTLEVQQTEILSRVSSIEHKLDQPRHIR